MIVQLATSKENKYVNFCGQLRVVHCSASRLVIKISINHDCSALPNRYPFFNLFMTYRRSLLSGFATSFLAGADVTTLGDSSSESSRRAKAFTRL
jgi:hypothetical protein